MLRSVLAVVLFSLFPLTATAADKDELSAVLGKAILSPKQTLAEVETFCEARVPHMPAVRSVADWEREANRMRAAVLERVVYRGEAARWRDTPLKVEWLDTIPGGPGYHIKKLRYEAVPGLWIPALLYEPDKLSGKVPAVMNVNGHDRKGKAADYKQIRCINQAKRGMLALNVEWLGMGQLATPGFAHGRMNQIDLCGTSGLAPFYLSMKRGLDVLLSLEHTDPERVAVTGLSGGGWQTIFISSLDTRVKLTDPVAGYSSFRTRVRHHKDLGDSEQTPCDLATVADYTHLTAMMAPRPTLLTFNSKDDCCFEAGYALPPLMEAAGPIFKLYGKERFLRSHVNDDPGTHNYLKDNRQAFYRMVGDFFYTHDAGYSAVEIPCDNEVKSAETLAVPLPPKNADFHTLALELSKALPHGLPMPKDAEAARKWRHEQTIRLRDVVRSTYYREKATEAGSEEYKGFRVTRWKLRLDNTWTVPVVELAPKAPKRTVLVLDDVGRRNAGATVKELLAAGDRVLAVDLFYLGECQIPERGYLFALLVAAVGERPLGIQSSQLAAVARWGSVDHKLGPVTLKAIGPRASAIVLVAAAMEEQAIAAVELHDCLASFKQVIEQDRSVDQTPELFCFGLLETFDIKQLFALVAPRPVRSIQRPRD
jgi:hypothetical protein